LFFLLRQQGKLTRDAKDMENAINVNTKLKVIDILYENLDGVAWIKINGR
jgi:hypothetical protein